MRGPLHFGGNCEAAAPGKNIGSRDTVKAMEGLLKIKTTIKESNKNVMVALCKNLSLVENLISGLGVAKLGTLDSIMVTSSSMPL